MRLTNEQIRFYRDNGFLAVEGVVPNDRIDAMRRRFDALCAEWDGDAAKRLGAQQEADFAGAPTTERSARAVRRFALLSENEPVFADCARGNDLLNLVEALIGSSICLYTDQAFMKPPLIGTEKMAHQDNAYFRVTPDDALVTAWCAIDDATLENGCMHYVAGSHLKGLVEHRAVEGTPHLIPDGFDPDQTVAVPMKAGGVIFHHPLTLHYSPMNRTEQWRRAYAIHYVRADARTSQKDIAALPRLR